MIYIKNKSNNNTSGGFTLLFAVIISSLLLSIGVAILDLALKQFSLSSTGKNSQIAFYAADDGLECGLFWDRNAGGVQAASVFATSSQSVPMNSIYCNGASTTPQILNDANDLYDSTHATSYFWIYYATTTAAYSSAPCAYVEVVKTGSLTSTTSESTQVDSSGYDICNSANPTITERSIESNY